MTDPLRASIALQWPVGPRYDDQEAGTHAWVRYKLRSAMWYIDALRAVGIEVVEWDRFVGVEMAMDGALMALCGSFDAAVGAVCEAAEKRLGIPESEFTPAHMRSHWRKCKPRLVQAGFEKHPAVGAVQEALDAPAVDIGIPLLGWLEQVRRLRNRAVHENTIARSFSVSVGGRDPATATCLVSVAGLVRAVDPLAFLTERHGQLVDLCESLLCLFDELGAA